VYVGVVRWLTDRYVYLGLLDGQDVPYLQMPEQHHHTYNSTIEEMLCVLQHCDYETEVFRQKPLNGLALPLIVPEQQFPVVCVPCEPREDCRGGAA
jgi:hypothetical protein